MPTLDGHLLDGKMPVRHPVVVHLSSWGLQWIRKGHAERQLRWSDVIAFQTLGTEQQLELPAETEEEVNPILLFSRDGFRSALSELPEVEQELTSRLGERKHSALRWLLIALITIPAMFVLVLTLAPRAHVFVSVEQEARLGGMLREQMVDVYQRSGEEDREAALQQLVDRLKPAASPYPYRVTLIEEEMVNAFAAPGGEILVFTGLFREARTPEALAGVLAHEIAHVEERHGIKSLFRSAGALWVTSAVIGGGFESLEIVEAAAELSSLLLILGYSRDLEREADAFAIQTLQREGIPLRGLEAFFRRLACEEGVMAADALNWLSSHPGSDDRAEAFQAAANPEQVDNPAWLDALEVRLFPTN